MSSSDESDSDHFQFVGNYGQDALDIPINQGKQKAGNIVQSIESKQSVINENTQKKQPNLTIQHKRIQIDSPQDQSPPPKSSQSKSDKPEEISQKHVEIKIFDSSQDEISNQEEQSDKGSFVKPKIKQIDLKPDYAINNPIVNVKKQSKVAKKYINVTKKQNKEQQINQKVEVKQLKKENEKQQYRENKKERDEEKLKEKEEEKERENERERERERKKKRQKDEKEKEKEKQKQKEREKERALLKEKERQQNKYLEVQNEFQKFFASPPKQVKYNQFPQLFNFLNPKNENLAMRMLGAGKYFLLILMTSKPKNLISLFGFIAKIIALEKNFVELPILEQKYLKKSWAYLIDNYMKFPEKSYKFWSSEQYTNQNVVQLAEAITKIERIGWLQKMLYQMLVNKLNSCLETKLKQSQKFLGLLKNIPEEYIFDKKKILQDYFNRNINMWTAKQNFSAIMFDYLITNTSINLDPIFTDVCFNKLYYNFGSKPRDLLQIISRVYQKIYDISSKNNILQCTNSLMKQILKKYLTINKKFRSFITDDCLKNMSSKLYEDDLNKLLEEIIEEIYSKMSNKDKEELFARAEAQNLMRLVGLFLENGTNEEFYQKLVGFYSNKYRHYKFIDQSCKKFKKAYDILIGKLEAHELNYDELNIFNENSQVIMKNTKQLKKESQKVSQLLKTLSQKYKNIAQNILDTSKVLGNINDQKATTICHTLKSHHQQIQSAKSLNSLKIPAQIHKLLQKYDILVEVVNLPSFQNILSSTHSDNQIQWMIASLSRFQEEFKAKVGRVTDSDDMQVKEFIQYFGKITDRSLRRILKICELEDSEQKIDRIKSYLSHEKQKIVHDFLKGIQYLVQKFTIEQAFDNLLELIAFNDKIIISISAQSGEDEKFTILDLQTGMKNINKLLKSLNLNFFKIKQNLAVEVISNISEHLPVIQLASKCNNKDLGALVDFIAEDDEQMINVITEFSTVVRLIQKIKKETKFVEVVLTIANFAQELRKQKQVLWLNIANCDAVCNTISMKMEQSGDRSFSFKHEVSSIIKNSVMEVISYDSWETWEIHIKFKLDDKMVERSINRIREFRDKTTLFIGESEENKQQSINFSQSEVEKIVLFRKFHQLFRAFQMMAKATDMLLQEGFPPQGLISFEDRLDQGEQKYNFEVVKIFQHNEDRMNKLVQRANQLNNNQLKWSENMKILWNQSFLASHLNGRKMKILIKNIVVERRFDETLQTILNITKDTQIDIEKQTIIEFLSQPSVQSIYYGYSLFFRSLAKFQHAKTKETCPDSPFLVYHESELNLYWIIFCLNNDVSVCDVLFCSPKTKENDVQRFLIRAIKSKTYSFIINSHRLDEKAEHVLFTKLSQMKDSRKLYKSNLVFIETRRDHRVFQTLTSRRFNYKTEKFENLSVSAKAIQNAIHPCKVVFSESPSSGKSYWILRDIAKFNRVPKFLSLNGEIDEKIVSDEINRLNLNRQTDALVIQIASSHNASYLNQVLARILLFRCLQIGVSKIAKQIPIYVEIANIYNFKHFEILPILKLISGLNDVVVKIPKFNLQTIDIDSNTTRQFLYVTEMLNLITSGEINKREFMEVQQIPNNVKDLLRIHLFEPLQAKKEPISGYLYSSFIKKLYHNFKAFNEGFFMIDVLEHVGLSGPTIRSQILLIIIQNTRDFLKQYLNSSMYAGTDFSQENFKDKLRNLGLLIIPVIGGGFSFVFSSSQSVPKILQAYMMSQQGNQNNFQQQFCLSSMSEDARVQEIKKRLKRVTGVAENQVVHISPNYKLTEDNFFKMCIILYRIQSGIPVVLMGESGVGKTSLITELIKIIKAELIVFQVHAGKRKRQIHGFVQNIITQYKINEAICQFFTDIELSHGQKVVISIQEATQNFNSAMEVLGLHPRFSSNIVSKTLDKLEEENLKEIKISNMKMIFKKLLSQEEIKKITQIKAQKSVSSARNNIKLLVLIDEYNTTEQVYIFKELIIDRRYQNQSLPEGIVFIACCNPYILNAQNNLGQTDGAVGLSFKKAELRQQSKLSFKVEPPPQSMRQVTEDYQQLDKNELRGYAQVMLSSIKNAKFIAEIISNIHEKLHKRYGKSCASLRDIERFRRLYHWFEENCPTTEMSRYEKANSICKYYTRSLPTNVGIDFEERILIVTLCACYVSKAQSQSNKEQIIKCIGEAMNKTYSQIVYIYDAEQVEFLKRMVSNQKIVMNKALKQNVFLMLICIMNKIANLTIGVPGCSKSLSISLIQSNLRGKDSKSQFYKKFPQVRIIPFQASQACTSAAIQSVFDKAEEICIKMKKYENIIFVVMIDEIGLAEYSPDNPLKVLHSRLELTQRKYSVVGISNWGLDNAKASRFLICSRTLPNLQQINQTAIQLLRAYVPKATGPQILLFTKLSEIYYNFMREWRHNRELNKGFPEFFGLRDKYSFEKYIYTQLQDNPKPNIPQAINNSIKMNFDGQQKSVLTFINMLAKVDNSPLFQDLRESAKLGTQIDPIQQCQLILNTKGSRCLMLIIPSDVLLPAFSKYFKNSISLHGSNFEQDKSNEDYNLSKIAQITSYVAKPHLIIMKDMNEVIYTALYDLFNKNYTESGDKKFCRVASGANMKPRVQVSQDFNAILFVHENDILNGKVDSAFLNRFCKIYFKLTRFLVPFQFELVKKVKLWIQSVVKPIVTKNSCLNLGNFFVNCSQNALFSMAISLRDENNDDKQQIMKQLIIRNRTFQVDLAIKHNIFRLAISKDFQPKHQNHIVFTYDLDCEFEEDNLFEELGACETIYVSKIRQQKNLDKIFRQFLSKEEKVIKIKLNYENHSHLFNQILFKIDQVIKTGNQNSVNKTFVLIVFLKRYKITVNNPCISYLYPFEQQFIPLLPRKQKVENSSLPNILKSKNYLQFYQSCNNKQFNELPEKIIFAAFNRIRPVFRVPEAYKQKIQQYWNQVKKSYSQNEKFNEFVLSQTRKYCNKKAVNKETIQKYFKDNEIYSRCSNVVDSLRRYAVKLIEDAVTIVILNVIKKGNLAQFDRREIFKILQINDKDLIVKVNRNVNKLDAIFQMITQRRDVNELLNTLVKRQVQSNPVQVRLPNIFPYGQVQLSFYYTVAQNEDEQEKPAQNNLQSKIQELFLKTRLGVENKKQTEMKAEISILLKQVESEYTKSSIFTKYQFNEQTQANELVWDYLPQFCKDRECVEILLYDIASNLYRSKVKEPQILTEIYKLTNLMKQQCDLCQTITAISADIEVMKMVCNLIIILRQGSYQYDYGVELKQQNPTLIIKQHLLNLVDMFFNKKILMGGDSTLQAFGSIQNFLHVLTKIDQILKKLQKQKYLQISLPKQFILMCRWLNRIVKIVSKENLKQVMTKWIQSNKKKGFYLSVIQTSYSLLENKTALISMQQQAQTQKQLQDLFSFIGSKLLYFWYRRQIQPAAQDEDEEKGETAIALFCQWLYKLSDISIIFAESICLTLNYVFNIGEDGDGLSYLRRLDEQLGEQQQARIDQRMVDNLNKMLVNQNSNMNIALNNYGYYNFNSFQNIDQANYQQQWHKAFTKIKDKKQMDNLASIFNFAFCKMLMKWYIQMVFAGEANQFTAIVNANLSQKTQVAQNLGVYGLKCLRKKCISLNQMKNWIDKQIAPWMLQFQNIYSQQQIALLDPPTVKLSAEYQQLIKKVISSNFSQVELGKLMYFNQTHQQLYWTISTVMKYLYSTKKSPTHEKVKNIFNTSNLSILVKRIISCYCDKFVTDYFKMPDLIDQIELEKTYYHQFPFLNTLNWFVALAETQNPLINSFVENGEFPAKYGEFINSRHIICGVESPFRRNLDNIVKFHNKDIGVYKCSRTCDFIFCHAGCGYPAQYFDCKICKQPSGGAHNLRGLERGAKRLGPCLYLDNTGTKFNRDRHERQSGMSWGNFITIQSYWPSFAIYLSEQGIQLSNKIMTKVQQGDLRLTGYQSKMQKHQLNEIQRIGIYSKQFLRSISCTIMYFAAQLKWIPQAEVEKTFSKAFKVFTDQQLQQALQLYNSLSTKIEQIFPWFCGVTREVFMTALNYHDECVKFHQRKNEQIDKVIAIAQRQLPARQGWDAKLVNEVIIPDMRGFKNNIKYTWSTVTVYSRQNFQQIIDSKMKLLVSNEKQLEFIQKVQKVESKQIKLIDGDSLLLQLGEAKQFEVKYPFIHHISLVRELPHQKTIINNDETQKWLQCYLPQIRNYPLLQQIIKRPEIALKLYHYRTLLCFLTNFMNACDRKITRQLSKTELICNFFLKYPEQVRKKWLQEFEKFKESWNYFLNQNGKQIQYNCKVLGKFDVLNQNSTINKFLPDTKQDVTNPVGMFIHYALMLIALDYNKQLAYLYKFSSKSPSKIRIDPAKVTPDMMITINLQYIQQQISVYTNYSCSYGKTVGKVTFAAVLQDVEDKFLSNGYFLQQQLAKIQQITFQGQNMLSDKYTTCLQQLKRSKHQKQFAPKYLAQLQKSLSSQLTINEQGFYNKSRDCLDSLQIIMIYYRTFLQQTRKNMSIGQFIVERGINKQTACVFEDRRYAEVPIDNLIALYELIEDAIGYKADRIVPEEYKMVPEEDAYKACVNYVDQLARVKPEQAGPQQVTLQLLYKANQRLILRRMLNFNASMTEHTVGFSLTRLDFWPVTFNEECLYEVMGKLPIKITEFYTFYVMLKQRIDEKMKAYTSKQKKIEEQNKEVVKKQQIQDNNKKKQNRVKQTFKRVQIDA